jgi:hypothetical protein
MCCRQQQESQPHAKELHQRRQQAVEGQTPRKSGVSAHADHKKNLAAVQNRMIECPMQRCKRMGSECHLEVIQHCEHRQRVEGEAEHQRHDHEAYTRVRSTTMSPRNTTLAMRIAFGEHQQQTGNDSRTIESRRALSRDEQPVSANMAIRSEDKRWGKSFTSVVADVCFDAHT